MYQDILKSIGLQPKEALVYEALLKIGETSVKPLLRETGLKRGNLYDILYSLEKQGLCELSHKDKKTRFRPTSPKNLKEIADLEQERLLKTTRELGVILPKLEEQFFLNTTKPFVAYYQGLEGVKKIHKLILEKRKPFKIFASFIDRNNQALRELMEKQAHKQGLLGIPHQALVPASNYVTSPEKMAQQKKRGIEIRVLKNFDLASQIAIFGDSVAISAFTPQIMTTYIENSATAKTLEVIFNLLWQQARSVG